MNLENPYGAPGEEIPGSRKAQIPSLAQWLRTAAELMRARFSLALGISGMALLLFAGGLNSCIGIFVLPHIAAGWAVAAFVFAGASPAFESLFQAFQAFGRVFVAGLLYGGLVILAALAAAVLVFGVFFLVGFWSTALNQPTIMQKIDALPSEDLGFWIIAVFQLVWIVLLGYPMARSQLAFVFIVTRGLPAPEAFRESWRITSPIGFRLTFIRACAHTVVTAGLALCLIPGLLILPYFLALRGVIARTLLEIDDQRTLNVLAQDQKGEPSFPG